MRLKGPVRGWIKCKVSRRCRFSLSSIGASVLVWGGLSSLLDYCKGIRNLLLLPRKAFQGREDVL